MFSCWSKLVVGSELRAAGAWAQVFVHRSAVDSIDLEQASSQREAEAEPREADLIECINCLHMKWHQNTPSTGFHFMYRKENLLCAVRLCGARVKDGGGSPNLWAPETVSIFECFCSATGWFTPTVDWGTLNTDWGRGGFVVVVKFYSTERG